MRNLNQYPVTRKELIEYLDKLYQNSMKSPAIGSMDTTILMLVGEFLQLKAGDLDQFLVDRFK